MRAAHFRIGRAQAPRRLFSAPSPEMSLARATWRLAGRRTRQARAHALPGFALKSALRTAITIFALLLLCGCERSADRRAHVVIWHQKIGGERDLFHEQVARFNAAHPDIRIDTLYKENEELRNLFVIAAVAGQGPDLIYGPADNVGVFVTTKTVLPLDRIFPEDFFDRFTQQGIVSWKDARWMVADQIGNHLTLVYNTELVQKP